MDISSIASASAYNNLTLPMQIDASILSKNLDTIEEAGASMIQMMEQSVHPELGQSIDIRI